MVIFVSYLVIGLLITLLAVVTDSLERQRDFDAILATGPSRIGNLIALCLVALLWPGILAFLLYDWIRSRN